MYAPRPLAVSVVPPKVTTSETMEAFQAPPEAVMPPVTYAGKIPGTISRRQRCRPRTPRSSMASRRSVGMAMAPAMALKRMYHWAPRAISRMPPRSIDRPVRSSSQTASGKRKLAGKLASTWTTGWAMRVSLGEKPIHTPTGTQTTVATATRTTTRARVARPSSSGSPNTPRPVRSAR